MYSLKQKFITFGEFMRYFVLEFVIRCYGEGVVEKGEKYRLLFDK